MGREPFALKHENIWIVPVCHFYLEFAQAVRQAIRAFQPAQIAVELTPDLKEAYLDGVRRLPYLTLLLQGEREKNEATVFLLSPTDPFVEAARSALERDVPLHFVDLHQQHYPAIYEPMPDSYAVFRLGLEEYYRAYEAEREHGTRRLDETVATLRKNLARAEEQEVERTARTVATHPVLRPAFLRYLGEHPEEAEALKRFFKVDPRTPEDLQILDEHPELLAVAALDLYADFSPGRARGKEILGGIMRRFLDNLGDLPAEQARRQGIPEDEARERHMAHRVRELAREGPLLLVCGMAHAGPILRHLRQGTHRPERADPAPPLQAFNPSLDSIRLLGPEIPYVTAVYEMQRGGAGPDKVWEPPPPAAEPPLPAVRTRLEQLDRDDVVNALERLLGMQQPKGQPEPHWSQELKRLLAQRLAAMHEQPLDPGSLLGGDASEAPPAPESAPRVPSSFTRVFTFKTCVDRRHQLRPVYERLVRESAGSDGYLDRNKLLLEMWKLSARHYEDNTGDTFAPWQLKTMVQFGRNYAHTTGRLLPGLVQSVVAARGVADDNYAAEVLDLGGLYPWLDENSDLPDDQFDAESMTLAGMRIKRFFFQRRIPRLRERLLPIKQKKREEKPGEWAEEFNRGSICSYPPEDIVIEDYGRYLQKKAIQVLSEERKRVQPFTSSLLDGIDMRETIRNWAEQKRVYVQECQKTQGGTGSVVLIFDDDLEDRKYPWKMTWHGEHQQESDMAFYATPARAKIVGPGIARCEYGGFMLTYPPRRLQDVWSDPFYRNEARNKAEVLLLAGLEYSEDKHIAYVAAKPPRSHFRTLAARLGKKIVYLPIGQLSPVSLKKIRVFHVLSGHRLRQIAKDYIW